MSLCRRIVLGISGSSGPIYGIRLLETVRAGGDVEIHLVLSDTARRTIELETDYSLPQVEALAHVVHSNHDMAAAISSGSFHTDGMLIAPCSMRSLSEIAHSNTTRLITRAADVHLKERRPLVLIARETPLHLGHLRNMVAVTECGAVVLPPVPAFYHRPQTVNDIVDQTVGKALDLLKIEHDLFRRWEGAPRHAAGD